MCYYYLSFFSALPPSNILPNNKAASLPMRLQRPQFDSRLRKEAAKKRLGRGLTGWLMTSLLVRLANPLFPLSPTLRSNNLLCRHLRHSIDRQPLCIVYKAGQDRDFAPRASCIGLPIDLPASPLRYACCQARCQASKCWMSCSIRSFLFLLLRFWRLAQLGHLLDEDGPSPCPSGLRAAS